MVERYCDGVVPAPPEALLQGDRLLSAAAGLPETVAGHLRAFAFDRALDAIWAFVAHANRYVAEEEPWALARQAAGSAPDEVRLFTARLHGCLFSLAVALQTIAHAAAPLLPGSSLRLARKLGKSGSCRRPEPTSALIGSRVEAGVPLFPMATP
jgi:methionyl-tRNA synthetase